MTRILAFGDSLTAGYVQGDSVLSLDLQASYPTKLQLMLASTYTAQKIVVVNAGKFGEWALDALPRFQAAMSSVQPDAVLLLEGVNDLNALDDPGVRSIVQALDELINEARRRGVPVLIGTLPPTRDGSPKGPPVSEIVRLNSEIRYLVRAPYSFLVDLFAAFGNETSVLIGSDGLHPTEAGYLRIAQTYFEALRQRFELPPEPLPTSH